MFKIKTYNYNLNNSTYKHLTHFDVLGLKLFFVFIAQCLVLINNIMSLYSNDRFNFFHLLLSLLSLNVLQIHSLVDCP